MSEKHNASLKIEESIDSSFKLIETLFDTNDFETVISMAEQNCENSIFQSATKLQILMLKAILTMETEDFNKVPKNTPQTIELCDKFRRNKFLGSLMKLLKTPNYDKYEEIEIQAELIYAMMMSMTGLFGLLRCDNIFDLIRMINRLRIAKNSFHECKNMLKNRTKWGSEKSRLEFEAGCGLERAYRNLFISYLPPKLLKIVNFLGLKGYRNIGFSQLNKTAFELRGVYSMIAEVSILLYWMYVETHGSLGPKNLNLCEKIIRKRLESHPNNIPYKFLMNKLAQLNGNIDIAIDSNKQLLNYMDKNRCDTGKHKFHIYTKLFHWELMWSYALKCDWDECIKYSELVRKNALHSPAIFTYCEAIFRYVKGIEENNTQLVEEATKLFKIIPSLRIRYLGKTITFEKAAIDASKFFFQNNNFLLLPFVELLYSVNMFYIIDGNIELLEKFMIRVDKEVDKYAETLETGYFADKFLTALFFKGIILKHMHKWTEAQQCFKTVLKEKDRFETLLSIPPQSLMELGLIEMSLKNYEESKVILNKVLETYSDYMSEHLVHIRCYSALREMGVNTDNENECEVNIMEEYANIWIKHESDHDKSSAQIMAF